MVLSLRSLQILINTAGIDLGPLYGTRLLALVMCWTLWGVLCVQIFLYFKNYPKDLIWLKLLVLWIWILDTTHHVLLLKSVYDRFVIFFGDVDQVFAIVAEETWGYFPQALIAITVQGFLVYRIYKFSKNNWIFPILFIIVALFQLAVCIAYIAVASKPNSATILSSPWMKGLGIANFGVACVTDIIIALAICYLLIQSQSDNCTNKATTRLVKRLAVLSINTGAWTALFALLSMILFRVMPDSFVYTFFDITICSLYTNTILANLNLRRAIKCSDFHTITISATDSTAEQIANPSGHSQTLSKLPSSDPIVIGKAADGDILATRPDIIEAKSA